MITGSLDVQIENMSFLHGKEADMSRATELKESTPPHPGPNKKVISLKKRYSTALLTGITRNFVIKCLNKGAHYRCMYKRNSMSFSSVVDWSMAFYAYNAVPATMNG